MNSDTTYRICDAYPKRDGVAVRSIVREHRFDTCGRKGIGFYYYPAPDTVGDDATQEELQIAWKAAQQAQRSQA